tara:strand:+ start:5378 stop:5641 length:264 start_codon:yes stop_codon:yes gene_type:complete
LYARATTSFETVVVSPDIENTTVAQIKAGEADKMVGDLAAPTVTHQHVLRIINKLTGVNEKAQLEANQRKLIKSNPRFSLKHLVVPS